MCDFVFQAVGGVSARERSLGDAGISGVLEHAAGAAGPMPAGPSELSQCV